MSFAGIGSEAEGAPSRTCGLRVQGNAAPATLWLIVFSNSSRVLGLLFEVAGTGEHLVQTFSQTYMR